MKCDNIEQLIYDYVDGRLEPRLTQVVATHLETCEHCAQIALEWRRMADMLEHAPRSVPSENLVQQVITQTQATLLVGVSRQAVAEEPIENDQNREQLRTAVPSWRRFVVSETTLNVAASFVGALLLLVVGEMLLSGQGSWVMGYLQKPSQAAGAAGVQAVGNVFVHFGSYIDQVFSTVLRLAGQLGGGVH